LRRERCLVLRVALREDALVLLKLFRVEPLDELHVRELLLEESDVAVELRAQLRLVLLVRCLHRVELRRVRLLTREAVRGVARLERPPRLEEAVRLEALRRQELRALRKESLFNRAQRDRLALAEFGKLRAAAREHLLERARVRGERGGELDFAAREVVLEAPRQRVLRSKDLAARAVLAVELCGELVRELPRGGVAPAERDGGGGGGRRVRLACHVCLDVRAPRRVRLAADRLARVSLDAHVRHVRD
jgi:hypothetical protein